MQIIARLALLASLVALVGCHQQPPPNYGTSGGRLDPTRDSPAEYGVLDLRSADLVNATDKMARDIAQRLDISNRNSPPRIFVGEIENQTSRPYQNYQVFLNRLRPQLLSSGQRFGLDMRRERSFVESQRAREYGGKDYETSPEAYRSEAEYVLTAIVNDLPSGGTNYYMIEYQMVQLVDNALSGPNVGPGAIVWSNFYEVKFQ